MGMKWMLIAPHTSKMQWYGENVEIDIPLNLAYLGAMLEQDGHTVEVVDMPILNLKWDAFLSLLENSDADAFGITSITCTYPFALNAAKACKDIHPDAPVVIGGPHVTFTDEAVLQEAPYVDVVVRHEGEYTIQKVAHCFENGGSLSKIEGITFRSNGTVVRTPDAPFIKDLDALPLPARHLFRTDLYRKRNEYTSVWWSRGCPYNCAYCVPCKMFGLHHRKRSPGAMVDEIEGIVDDYHFSRVIFVDDLFTHDEESVLKLCNEIQERDLGVTWSCSSRVDTITPAMCEAMGKAGCEMVFFGFESGDERVLQNVKKRTTPSQAEKAIQTARDFGIAVQSAFVIGLPGDTPETVEETFQFIKRFDFDRVTISPLNPFPGTDMGDNPEKWGITIKESDWSKYTTMIPVCETETLSMSALTKFWMQVIKEHYTKPPPIRGNK
jgi:radical SAM superfamily enzyme YgiQ (UPF0313 family)